MRTGIADKVRKLAQALRTFTPWDIKHEIETPIYRGIGAMISTTLRDMRRRGEVRVLECGRYEYVGVERRTLMDIIWHLVRSHRQFSESEIERLSGAAIYTVREYLKCLREIGYVRKVRTGYWQMVQDPGPATPVNTAKCARLKRIRVQGGQSVGNRQSANGK